MSYLPVGLRGITAAAVTMIFSAHASASGVDTPVCSTLPVQTLIVERANDHVLMIKISNPTASGVGFDENFFLSNNLHLEVTRVSDGVAVQQAIPLSDSLADPAVVSPGATLVREIPLDVYFATLRETLKSSAVIVTSEFVMRPDDACFSGRIKTSLTIPKVSQGH